MYVKINEEQEQFSWKFLLDSDAREVNAFYYLRTFIPSLRILLADRNEEGKVTCTCDTGLRKK